MVVADCHLEDWDNVERLALDKAILVAGHLQEVEPLLLVGRVARDVERARVQVKIGGDGTASVDIQYSVAQAVVQEELAAGARDGLGHPGKTQQLLLVQAGVGAVVNGVILGLNEGGHL